MCLWGVPAAAGVVATRAHCLVAVSWLLGGGRGRGPPGINQTQRWSPTVRLLLWSWGADGVLAGKGSGT